jgi:hypothetical protein
MLISHETVFTLQRAGNNDQLSRNRGKPKQIPHPFSLGLHVKIYERGIVMQMGIVDDDIELPEPVVSKNKYGTILVNGKTTQEHLREYRKKYGEKAYKSLKSEIEELKSKNIKSP